MGGGMVLTRYWKNQNDVYIYISIYYCPPGLFQETKQYKLPTASNLKSKRLKWIPNAVNWQ